MKISIYPNDKILLRKRHYFLIMDIMREVSYAEKAGTGLDKIFTALLSKGKNLPKSIQTEHSIIFRVDADIYSEKLAELSYEYKQITNTDIDLEKLLVINCIYTKKKLTFQELEAYPFVNQYQLRKIIKELEELEFIETTGKTSGVKYIIHKNKLASTEDKISYSKMKKQTKARQIEAIIRYLDSADEIDNEAARKLLTLPDTDVSYVSRLFSEMVEKGFVEVAREIKHNQRTYKIKQSFKEENP